MHLIVGLGNPDEKYARTRHNIGFMVVDRLAERLGGPTFRRHCRSLVAELRCRGERVILAKPQTYMNRSGQAVQALLGWYKVQPEMLLVVYDDMDLPLGRLRLRAEGSAGTHNGMRSIVACLGRQDIPRLRVGIGAASDREATAHVLGGFRPEEMEEVERSLCLAVEAVETVIESGLETAMNKYNVK